MEFQLDGTTIGKNSASRLDSFFIMASLQPIAKTIHGYYTKTRHCEYLCGISLNRKTRMKNKLLILLPIFFAAFSLKAQEIVGSNDTTICHGSPAELHAQLVGGSYGTSSYSFETYAYTPEAYTGGTHVSFGANHDDQISGPFNIGFSFCFFNQMYTQFYVGSNGWVGFTYNASWTAYSAQPLPNMSNSTPKNCIFAPWLDWWPDNGTPAN